MSTTPPETDRNVTAFFDAREVAEQAIARLVETGVLRDRILLRAGAARKAAFVDDGKNLLQEVKELILPSEEPDAAVAAIRHEGFVLSVIHYADVHDAVFALLEQQGGKGVESREDIWPDWKSGQDRPPSGDEPATTDADDPEPESPVGSDDASGPRSPPDESAEPAPSLPDADHPPPSGQPRD